MMGPRRGFLALVGGSLLSASVLSRASAGAPTLILPPKLDLTPMAQTRWTTPPLLARFPSEMHAICHVKNNVDPEIFQLWTNIGLHLVNAATGQRA